jgi:Uma2 family endonuclease
LTDYYRSAPDVYVAGNLFIYYAEGDPEARFAPDVFVVFGVPRHNRRTYRLWEEKQAPAVVFEVSSRKTWLEDAGNKKALCARLRVAEYFLYDPEADYLTPSLQGFRLDNGDYRPIPPEADGALFSDVLKLKLRLEDNLLRLIDPATGERLLKPGEALQARRESEARAEAEAAARAEAETRLAALEAELKHLRGKSGPT